MKLDCCKKNFKFINADKAEIEKEAEFELPEYRSGIRKILASNAEIKIDEKEINNAEIYLSGEIIWKILYITEPDNKIKSISFSENFEKQIPLKNQSVSEDDEIKIFVRPYPVNFSAKLSGQRKIYARSKFIVTCDVILLENEEECKENEETNQKIQLKKKELDCADLKFSEKENFDISREISIDSEMPEIREILYTQPALCLKVASVSENRATIKGELSVSCLYESESEPEDYVSYEKTVPFEREVYIDSSTGTDIYPVYDLAMFSVSVENDDYSERRVLKITADVDVCLAVISNKKCCVVSDIYSTDCVLIPEMTQEKVLNFLGVRDVSETSRERVRGELRGISDILYSCVDITFSNPEFENDTPYINAKGILRLMGSKENGEIEGASVNISLKIPLQNFSLKTYQRKVNWINGLSVSSHECKIVNGEVMLSLTVCGEMMAFEEITEDVVSEYSESDQSSLSGANGFTLYYPESGESVWDVAKSHMVDINRFVAENNITGEYFDGKTAVLLH